MQPPTIPYLRLLNLLAELRAQLRHTICIAALQALHHLARGCQRGEQLLWSTWARQGRKVAGGGRWFKEGEHRTRSLPQTLNNVAQTCSQS